MENGSFIDYYEILQVSPNADLETIERVYRLLARRYHPDNSLTGDAVKFDTLTKAYRVLSDAERRAGYDAKYESTRADRWNHFIKTAPSNGGDEDKKVYQGILSLLFVSRKRDASRPGVGIIELERLLSVPEKHLEFHIWYLREKGWIQRDESGGFAITANGVDTVLQSDLLLRKDRFLPLEKKPIPQPEGTNPTESDKRES
jgi:curved DNA-binding protein